MARRKRMHGKRRRRSSCKPSPLKHNHRFIDAQANAMMAQAKKDAEKNPDSHFTFKPHPSQTKEALDAAELYRKQRWGEAPGYEGDGLFENILEFFDPIGTSSYDDFAREPNNPTEAVGVIPGLGGKAKKVKKAITGAIDLVKKTDPVKIATKIKGSILDGIEWLGVADHADDIYHDNIKPAIYSSDKKETTPRGTDEVHRMLGISKK